MVRENIPLLLYGLRIRTIIHGLKGFEKFHRMVKEHFSVRFNEWFDNDWEDSSRSGNDLGLIAERTFLAASF